MISEPRKLTENEINTAYIQMQNWGQNAVFYLGGRPAQSIDSWRLEQLAACREIGREGE